MKKLLDTNAILRYLLNDIPEQASQSERMIQSGAFTLPEIAINIYSKTAFDFVDCILISRKHILGDEIFSFDKKLNNYIKRI